MRVLFFGLPAGVSAIALRGLVDDGRDVAGVVVPAAAVPHLLADPTLPTVLIAPPAAPALSLGESTDLLSLAWERGLPVLAVADFDHADTLAALAAFAPDVAVVACFTRRIPPAALAVPRLGFLNLHPSLLPLYRGPQPLFWQLREGAPTGATVHYMDEGLDTGDIAAQTVVPLPDGISGPEAERTLALAGLGLLRGVLDELAAGVVRRKRQGLGGSRQHAPVAADFALSHGLAGAAGVQLHARHGRLGAALPDRGQRAHGVVSRGRRVARRYARPAERATWAAHCDSVLAGGGVCC